MDYYSQIWRDVGRLRDDFKIYEGEPRHYRMSSHLLNVLLGITSRLMDKFWDKEARIAHFLKREGLWEEYISHARSMSIQPEINFANAFYHLVFLKRMCVMPACPLSVVEIGAGSGLFAMMIDEDYKVQKYTIIDLPEMLELSKKTIQQRAPSLYQKCIFLSPEEADNMGAFDVAFNFNSFSEMNLDVVERYLALWGKYAKPGAISFTNNYILGENNPLLYNYRCKSIMWDENRLRRAKKETPNRHFSLSLFRIGRF